MKSEVFSRALLKAQAIAMLIACVNINRKVDINLNCIQEETSAMNTYQIVSDLLRRLELKYVYIDRSF